jgi:membrane-associated phospholipid phosphatase
MLQSVIQLIGSRKIFFRASVVSFALALFFLFYFGKADSFLLLNHFHTDWLDQFFIYFTFLGDGIFAIVMSLLCWFYFRKRVLAISLLCGYLASGLVAQAIKHLVVSPRPKSFFKPGEYDFFIHDYTHFSSNSFPSGHTATIFSLATVLVVVYYKKPMSQLGLLFIAWLIGYSRIYLAQHFLTDVLMGAFIGVVTSLIVLQYTMKMDEKKLYQKK